MTDDTVRGNDAITIPNDCDIADVICDAKDNARMLAVPQDESRCHGCRYQIEQEGRGYCRARTCVESYLLSRTGG